MFLRQDLKAKRHSTTDFSVNFFGIIEEPQKVARPETTKFKTRGCGSSMLCSV